MLGFMRCNVLHHFLMHTQTRKSLDFQEHSYSITKIHNVIRSLLYKEERAEIAPHMSE